MAFDLRKLFEEKIADINPFDGGKTGATVRANRAKPAPAQTISRGAIPVAQAQTRNVSIQSAPQRNISVQQAPQRRISIAPTQRIQPQVRVISPRPMPKPQTFGNQVSEFFNKGDDGKNFGDNVSDLLVGNTSKLINTANAGVVQPIVGAIQGKTEQQLQAEINKNLYTNRGGLNNVGTFFPDKEAYKRATSNPLEFGKAFTSAGVATATEVAPIVRGASLLAKPGLSTGQKVVRGATEGAVYGGAGTAAMQQLETGELDAKGIALGAGAGAVLGGGIPAAGAGVAKGAKGTARVAKDANRAFEQTNPRIKEIDEFEMPRLQQAFDVETNPVRRVQINRGLQQLNEERRMLAQGGYIAGPSAKGFPQAKKDGLVFDGVDGKPRFEVDDSTSKVNAKAFKPYPGSPVQYARMGDLLDHPELYKNYPELANIDVAATPSLKGRQNGLTRGTTDIEINPGLLKDPERLRSELLHEGQHAIQNKEKFAGGGSPSKSRPGEYFNLAGEAEARAVQARMNMPMSERYVTPKDALWHGTPSGSLQGAAYGLHLGTKQAAKEAVESRIGIRADGKDWDGSTAYGETKLAGSKTLKKLDPRGYNRTGFNASQNFPEEDFYIKDHPELRAVFSDGSPVSLNSKPSVSQYTLKGTMKNTPTKPLTDTGANRTMTKRKKDGTATEGYYYRNEGEDAGSISAVVPDGSYVSKATPRSTFYDSLDVPKEDLIIRNGDGVAMSIRDAEAYAASVNSPAEIIKDTLNYWFKHGKETKGGQMIKSEGLAGESDSYRRISEHNPFYSNFYKQFKRPPSKKDYEAEIKNQLEAGGGSMVDKDLSDAYQLVKSREIENEAAVLGSPRLTREQELEQYIQRAQESLPTKGAQPGKIENQLVPSVGNSIQEITPKVKGNAKNVPVNQMTREGDVVTSKNVNQNVKTGEKRYTVNEDGELVPDKKGATSLFTNDEGKVTGFRVGKDYFDAKELGDLSSVNGYGSILATARRNIERAFDKETGDKVNDFLVNHQQAQATKLIDRQLQFKQGMEELANDLGINFKLRRFKAKRVSAAIQDLGEKKRTYADIRDEFGDEMAQKIAGADKWFRKQYDDLLDEMNATLTQYGYEPVPKRDNYYTHFQDEGLWKSFGLKMQEIRDLASPTMQDANPGNVRGGISNKLAGMSEQTKPNKAFNPFALERKGDKHTSDAFQAFERYLNPTLNNIYMTPSISRARVVARAVAQEADVAGKDANNTIVQIREWANHLAGKSNRFDRPIIDTKVGGTVLKAAGWAQRKAGENTIVGNLATAFLQPIVLAQTTGKFGVKNFMLGAMQQIPGAKSTPQHLSGFLKRRYADSMKVTATALDKTKEVANTPLRVIEEEATRITWNTAYNDALAKGLKGSKAIKHADIETEKTVAGRSIGERPELFRSKAAGLGTMYQLEVNNYWQQVTKEMTKSQAAKTIVAAYAFNLGLQQVIGRDVGFNPIDAAIDSYDETKKEGKSNEEKAVTIAQRGAGEVVDNVPFVGMTATTLFGEDAVKKVTGSDSNTGRFGASSPIRTLADNPWMLASPVAGGQIKKTIEGTKAVMDGKLTDKEGKTLVNIPQTPGNYARGAAFGKAAIPEVNQYYNNIGKKKVDQKQVQNQTDSKAGRMNVNAGKSQAKIDAEKQTAKDGKKKADTGWTDEYHTAKKEFEEKSSKWSEIERYDKAEKLKTLDAKRHFSKDTTKLYDMAEKKIYAFLDSKDEKEAAKHLDAAVRYGDLMVERGLWKTNKLRDKNGNVQYTRGYSEKTASTGKKSGSKRVARGGKGSRGGKGGRKSAKGKFSYALDEFYKPSYTSGKSLRELLKKAQIKQGKTA